MEIYFVMNGQYDVGYELNRIVRYRLQFGQRTVVGGFNMANNIRMQFYYRAHNGLNSYAIRKRDWNMLCQENEYFTQNLNYKFVMFFSNQILKPLSEKKRQDVLLYEKRNDYKQFYVLEDMSPRDIFEMRIKIFYRIKASRNFQLEQFMTYLILCDKVKEYENLVEKILTRQQEALLHVLQAKGKINPCFDLDYVQQQVLIEKKQQKERAKQEFD